MANVACLLDQTLRAQSIPIVGVSIGDPSDRTTWRIGYDVSATPVQKQAGEALKASFDPTAPSVQTAATATDAQAAVNATIAKALCALMLDAKLNRRLTVADVPTVQAMFAQAVTYYEFIVSNNL